MSGFVGWMRIFEMASESENPTFAHVLPASLDLYTPSPGMMLPRMHDSPVPMNTMSGFDSDTATAPTEALVNWPSVTGAQVVPLSVVFQRPPPTAPKYASFGRPRTPLTAIERPPRGGPTLRHLYEFQIVESMGAAPLSGAFAVCTIPATPVTPANATAVERASRQGDIDMKISENCGWTGNEQ